MKMVSTFDLCDESIKNIVSDLKTINASVEVSDCEQDYGCDDFGCTCKKVRTVTITIDEPMGKTRGYEVHYGGRYDGCVAYGEFAWSIETEHFYIFGEYHDPYNAFGDIAFYEKCIVKEVVITDEI